MNKPGEAYDEYYFCESIYEMCSLFTTFLCDIHREHEELVSSEELVKFMSYAVHLQMEAGSRMLREKEKEIEEIRNGIKRFREERDKDNEND